MRRFISIAALGLAACSGGGPDETTPPAHLYADPVSFVGEWLGEVSGIMGTLRVDELEPLRYRGHFRAEDEPMELVLAMERVQMPGPGESLRPTNQVLFTWQDGRGGRGAGWLLINREDTALTGEYGYDPSRGGAGSWTFIRVE